jgi:hypothetical protein
MMMRWRYERFELLVCGVSFPGVRYKVAGQQFINITKFTDVVAT